MWTQRMTEPSGLRRAQLRVLAEARIERRLHYDALTGVANRNLFEQQLAAAIAQDDPRRSRVAVLRLDIDRFRSINESRGHAAGDELLRRLAARLRRAIGAGDAVCRSGADEFIVFLTGVASERDACLTATKLMVALSRPTPLAGRPLTVSVCAGISMFPSHGNTESMLMSRAGQALSQAKREGRGSLRVFGEPELRASA